MTTETPTINTVYKKIAAVMADIGAIDRDAKHTHGFKYRSADMVFSKIQASMIKHNLIILPQALSSEYRDDGQVLMHYLFTWIDPETGHSHACNWISGAVHTFFKVNNDGVVTSKVNDRAVNMAATNGLKYFLLETFLVNDKDQPELDSQDHDEIPVSRTTTNGNGAGQGKTQTKSEAWANKDLIDELLEASADKLALSQADVLKIVGIEKANDYAAWNAKFPHRTAAGQAIKDGAGSIDITQDIKGIAEQKSLPDIPDEDIVTPNQYDAELSF